MTANFSFSRLGKLIVKQWVENRRLYLMSTLALLGLLGIVFLIWAATTGRRYDEDSLYVAGLFGLFITGAIFASTTFSMLGTKDKGIYWISFPASHSEKFLVNLFFNVIVFTLVYACCFFLLKTLVEVYINFLIQSEPNSYSYRKIDWDRVNGPGPYVPAFFSAFFAVQAAFILGSASFKRFSFILTLIVIAALIFLFVFYMSKLDRNSFPGYSFDLFSLRSYEFTSGNDNAYKEYVVSPALKNSVLFFAKYLIAPFLWLITWFKLKEKQI